MRIAASVCQMALMAAIVATLLNWPPGVVVGALLGLLAFPWAAETRGFGSHE